MGIRTVEPVDDDDGLPLAMEDVNRERPFKVGQNRLCGFRVELVDGDDRVVPPARHVNEVLEDGGRIQVLNRRSSQDGLPIEAVVVDPLDEVEVRVDPVDVSENK